jgi:peptide/nickel transport system substrate-binding protein
MQPFDRPLDDIVQSVSRRRFLQLGAGLGGAVILGGCASDTSTSPTTSGSSASTSATTSTTASTSATTGASTGSSVVATGPSNPASSIAGVRTGGRLRAGIANGGPSDTLDPTRAASGADFFRIESLFEALTHTTADIETELLLAESIEPNADGTEWTIRIRDGVVFHNGKALTIDDVIYTFNRTNTVSVVGREVTNVIDFASLKRMDDRTVRVPLTTARAEFPADLSQVRIVQVDADDASFVDKPIGTGPFSFTSFTPGESSLFTKNANYWQNGKPYLDELEFITIADGTARINALLGDQVDAADQMLYTQAKQYQDSDEIVVNVSNPGNWVPMTMACDTAPFDDVRVRQAMRLIADRAQLVANAQLGYGEIGNDLFAKGLPGYNDQLPQREQDLDQAKSLLKSAGKEGLKVTLDASSVSPGMLESATLFAEQAKGAGVEVTINNVPAGDYYGPNYLKYTFGQSSWVAGTVTGLMQASVGPNATYNETHFVDEKFNDLFTQAQATLDQAKRNDMLFECQKILYDNGGYIIWGLSPYIDALSTKVQDMLSTPTYPLGGGDFRSVWLDG